MMILKFAWRSLWRNRRRTIITISSIAIGTTLALFMISMADGMYGKLVEDAVRMNAGHVTIEHKNYEEAPSIDLFVPAVSSLEQSASEIDGVALIKPMIIGQAVISTGSGSAGAGVMGVKPEIELKTSPLARNIVSGRYIRSDDERGVMIGAALAERLELEPGRKLVITTNDVTGELVGEMLRVNGIFKTGMEEADGFLVQVPLDVARRIFHLGPDQATRIGLILRSPDYQKQVIHQLRPALSDTELGVLPWQEVMSDLAGFMAVDKGGNYVFQGIIIFLLSFTILNTILMSVLERTHEFATLLALGTSPTRLRLQIITESTLLGIVGTMVGLVLGGSISYYFQVNGLDLSSLYGEGMTITGFAIDPVIHNQLTLWLLTWLGMLVFGLTVVIGIYPALRSTMISIPDVLRSR